jgi:Protein of unknown function (DUF3631)
MGKTKKALTQNSLARLLKNFHIRPDGIRVGEQTPNGYRLAQFTDVFRRYLPPEGETDLHTSTNAINQVLTTLRTFTQRLGCGS